MGKNKKKSVFTGANKQTISTTAKKSPTKKNEQKQEDLYSQIFADNSEDSDLEVDKGRSTAATLASIKPSSLGSQKSLQKKSPIMGKKVKESGRSSPTPDKSVKGGVNAMKFGKSKQPLSLEPVKKKGKIEDSSESEGGEDFEFDDSEDNEEEEEEEQEVNMDTNDDDEEEEESNEEESEDSEEEEDEESVNQTTLRKQLKDLSYEELESLKQKMGLKEYNEAMFASKTGKSVPRNKKRRKFEKTNKHRPKEISSKIRVPKLRQIVAVPTKVRKDPRFDNQCGEFNEKIWNTEYSFIRDIQKTEAEDLKKKIKSVDDKSTKKEMRKFIQRVTDKEKSIEVKQREELKRKQDKEENKKRVAEGKRPFYVKKSTKKLLELVEKYDELKSSGKLENYLKKKRKKNAIRDKKTLTG